MMPEVVFAPLTRIQTAACDHSLTQATRIAESIVDGTGLAEALEYSLTSTVGAPRRVSWRTVLVVYITAGIRGGDMHISLVHRVANEMLRDGLIPSRVSYSQLWDNLDHLTTALDAGRVVTAHCHPLEVVRSTGELLDCPVACTGGRAITREVFASLLLNASAFPDGSACDTGVFAIDSTDKEAWAARRSWDRKPDVDTSSGAVRPEDEGEKVTSAETFSTPGWPRVGSDGRAQHTVDACAREGYRSGKNLRAKEVFCGYDVHIATPVPEFGSTPLPHTALAVVTAPAGSDKAAAGLLTLDALVAAGRVVREVLSDRGYTYLTAEKWATQLRARGIEQTLDLVKNQRGVRPGPVEHSIWVDGGLFSTALPERLRTLPGFSLNMTTEDKVRLTALYDERIAYAFAPFGDVDDTGGQRYRGPALRGLVRCPNNPVSWRKGYDRPTLHCEPARVDARGKKVVTCGCSRTVTVPFDLLARERQALLFGTTQWVASYGRRSAIESLNSELRTHRGMNFSRSWCRVRGAARNHALIAFGLIGVNVRKLRDWYTTRKQRDPWLVAIGDDTDPDFEAENAHRVRRPRRRALHERLAHPDIPRRREPRPTYPRTGVPAPLQAHDGARPRQPG